MIKYNKKEDLCKSISQYQISEFLKELKRQREELFEKSCVNYYREVQKEKVVAMYDGQVKLLDELIEFFK